MATEESISTRISFPAVQEVPNRKQLTQGSIRNLAHFPNEKQFFFYKAYYLYYWSDQFGSKLFTPKSCGQIVPPLNCIIVSQSLLWADLGLPSVCVCVCLVQSRNLNIVDRF